MVTVSHRRLEKDQNYQHQICLSCVTGIYGCRWKRYRRSTEPTTLYEKVWLGVVITSFISMLLWMYFWLIAQNDIDDFNWFVWESLRYWFDWFTLLFALCITALLYVGVLLILAISHCFTGQQLYLHWLHKALQVLVIIGGIITVIMLSKLWGTEFDLLAISLQVTAPILQIVLVVILTTLTWPYAGIWYRTERRGTKVIMFLVYAAVMAFFYLIPLFLDVPCVAERIDLPPRPKMMAHRGAEQIAPENTYLSYETAANHSVFGFESDVRISLDGVPFLMHDDTIDRTTNVGAVFPNRTEDNAAFFTWEELRKLDAGSWFLKRDPFRTVKSLSRETKARIKEQRVMSLQELMEAAIRFNRSVIFDLFCPPDHHPFGANCTEHTVDVILKSGIRQNQIWWLQGGPNRAWVQQVAPGFIQVAEGKVDSQTLQENNITKVNAEYSEVTDKDIYKYSSANITSNIYTINEVWLFSLYWCVGAHSITTSACHMLESVNTPIWHMTRHTYLIVWVLVDAVSVVCIALIFLLQRVRNARLPTDPESISLNSPRQKSFTHHHHHHHHGNNRKSDKEALYQSSEDTPVTTPTREGLSLGNTMVLMENPVADLTPPDHKEVELKFE